MTTESFSGAAPLNHQSCSYTHLAPKCWVRGLDLAVKISSGEA